METMIGGIDLLIPTQRTSNKNKKLERGKGKQSRKKKDKETKRRQKYLQYQIISNDYPHSRLRIRRN